MICVGKSGLQPSWELCSPGIRHQQQSLGPRDLEKQQQVRSVYSSLDIAGKSSPNELHNLTLPSQVPRLRYGPALAFRSSKIIDLLAQDPSIAVDSKIYSFRNSSASAGNFLQPSQFNFSYANSGQNLGPDDLSSVTRGDTKLRAEGVSRKPPQENSDNWKKTYGEDSGGSGGSSIWDGNAENVRRRRFTKPYYSLPDVEENPSPSFRERNNRSENYSLPDVEENPSPSFRGRNNRSENYSLPDVEENPSPSFRGRNNRSQKNEWDYESEESNSDDESNEEADDEDDDDEEEDPSWFSWLNEDLKEALTLMRWGVPAAFLLGTAVMSSMIGNPLTLLFAFTIFPSAVKYLNPYAKQFFRYVANPFGSSSSRRRKTRTRPASTYNRRSQDTARYTDFRSPSQTISTSYDSDVPKQEARSSTSALGGWDDLVEDRSRSNRQSQWPLQKRPKSKKKLAKREQPLFIRILLAFFPFLRSWGGSL